MGLLNIDDVDCLFVQLVTIYANTFWICMQMTEQQAMRLALEALEEINKLSVGENAIFLPAEIDGAMEALRQALANLALERMAENARELGLDYEPVWNNLPSNKDVEDAMRQKRLNQLTASPVALEQQPADVPWEKFCDSNCVWTDHHPDCKLAKDEPVAHQFKGLDGEWHNFINKKHYEEKLKEGNWPIRGLYTHPQPAAKRKPLTDEEILHRVDTHVGGINPSYPLDNSDWINFARAIEATLRSKNT